MLRVRVYVSRTRTPPLWRRDVVGAPEPSGEATSGGAGGDWKEGGKDRQRSEKAEAETDKNQKNGEPAPKEGISPRLGAVAPRNVTLTAAEEVKRTTWPTFPSLFHNRGQQRKHSRSEYWNLAGSLECVRVQYACFNYAGLCVLQTGHFPAFLTEHRLLQFDGFRSTLRPVQTLTLLYVFCVFGTYSAGRPPVAAQPEAPLGITD